MFDSETFFYWVPGNSRYRATGRRNTGGYDVADGHVAKGADIGLGNAFRENTGAVAQNA